MRVVTESRLGCFRAIRTVTKIDVTKRHVRVVESLETGLAFCERIALRNSNAALGRAQSAHLRKAATVKTGLSSSPSPASTAAGTAELDRN